jgi:hypothetical protein
MAIRQPVEIKLGERSWRCVVDFAAIDHIEERFTLWSFVRQMDDIRMRDVAWLLYSVVSQKETAITYAEFGNLVLGNWDAAKAAATAVCESVLLAQADKPSKKKVTDAQESTTESSTASQ